MRFRQIGQSLCMGQIYLEQRRDARNSYSILFAREISNSVHKSRAFGVSERPSMTAISS